MKIKLANPVSKRAEHSAIGADRPVFTGAPLRNRTADLLITSEMLYQLS